MCIQRGYRLSLFLILICMILAGCGKAFPPGDYYGTVWIQNSWPLPSLRDKRVLLHAEPGENHTGTVSVRSLDKKNQILPRPILITKIRSKSFDLTLPDLNDNQPIHLKKTKHKSKNCYEGGKRDAYEVWVCFEASNFTLDVTYQRTPRIYLTGAWAESPDKLEYELPQIFTISNAIEISLNKNSDILANQETLKQAKEAARKAYLSLLPRINLTSTLTVAGLMIPPFTASMLAYDSTYIYSAVGDFVPFLFPNRWLDARSQKYQAEAVEIANLLTKANIATSVHTLALGYLGHRDVRDELVLLRTRLGEFMKMVYELEAKKAAPAGAGGTIEAAYNDLDAQTCQAIAQVKKDGMAISQLLGLDNPDAVAGIERGHEVTSLTKILAEYEELEKLPLEQREEEEEKQKKDTSDIATSYSFEWRQQQYLRKAAEVSQKNVLLNWLDVAQHPTDSLSFTMISDYKIGESALALLDKTLHKTLRDIGNKTFETLRDRHQMVTLFKIAERNLHFRRKRLDDAMALLKKPSDVSPPPSAAPSSNLDKKPGSDSTSSDKKPSSNPSSPEKKSSSDSSDNSFDPDKTQTYLQDLVTALNTYYSTRSAIEMDQAMLDRTTLQGPYYRLLPHLKEENLEVKSLPFGKGKLK